MPEIRLQQLSEHLHNDLAPAYLLSGDEPLQVMEAADAVRAAARAQGFSERLVFHCERGFDWNQVLNEADSLSLFGDRRLIEVRIKGKPDAAAARALVDFLARSAADACLLAVSGALERAQTQAKWMQTFKRQGVLLRLWPVDADRLPQWIHGRMRARGVQPSREAVSVLAERVEGNLLAAAQEIDKIALLAGGGRVDDQQVVAAVADSARFNVFGWVDAVLAGDASRAVRMAQGLRAEGTAPNLLIWALARELRALAVMAAKLGVAGGIAQVLTQARVWDRRKPLLQAVLQRHSAGALRRFLSRCNCLERTAKGQAAGNVWDELIQLSLCVAAASHPSRSGGGARRTG